MFAVSPQYRQILATNNRHIEVFISLGTDADTTAADDITSMSGNFLPMSNTAQLIDAVYELTPGLATYEGKGIPTKAGVKIAPPLSSIPAPPYTGIWSDVISDKDNNIDWQFTVSLSAPHTSAMSLYFSDYPVVAGRIEYYHNDVKVAEVEETDNTLMRWQTTEKHTYDKLIFIFEKTSVPFTHVRIAEVEFGATIAFSKEDLTPPIKCISDHDPTGITSPISEVEFTVNNVLGSLDEDNPDRTIDRLVFNNPVEVSFSVNVGRHVETVPYGTYFITERNVTTSDVKIIAQDIRSAMAAMFPKLTISTSQSFGDLIEITLTDRNIPHTVDVSLFSKFIETTHSYEGDVSLLDIMLHIGQYLNMELKVDRKGIVSLEPLNDGFDYGVVGKSLVYIQPGAIPSTKYNGIKVSYGADNTEYSEDFRPADSEVPSYPVQVTNPLITSVSRAKVLAERVRRGLYTERESWTWLGDPALDMGDFIRVPTRFTEGSSLPEVKIVSEELTFNGLMKVNMEGIR